MEATPDAAGHIISLLRSEVSAQALISLPADQRAAMLMQLVNRDQRDDILKQIGKGIIKEGLAAMQEDAKALGYDPRVAAGQEEARKEALSEKEATIKAIMDIKQSSSSWESMPPVQVAEIIRSGRIPPIVCSATLAIMDARDGASVLDSLDALAGSEVQAKVLARLPLPIRRDLAHRLGQLLSSRLSRGAVSKNSSGIKQPSSVMVARFLCPRSPTIGAAVIASMEPSAGWAVLQSSRPQQRASYLASMLPSQKARLATYLDSTTAARLLLSLAPRDLAGSLLALGKDAQGGVLLAMSPTEQKQALTNVQKYGLGDDEDESPDEVSSDSLREMGPAKQALVLSHITVENAGILIYPLDEAERSSALAGLDASRRDAILAAIPEPEEEVDDDEDGAEDDESKNQTSPTRSKFSSKSKPKSKSTKTKSSSKLGSFMSRKSSKKTDTDEEPRKSKMSFRMSSSKKE